jgi:hypothetical protein
MRIVRVATGEEVEVVVEPVKEEELKKLTVKRYFFRWKEVARQAGLYKMVLQGDEDIKGVAGFIDYPDEARIEIKLLAASRENVILKREKGKKEKEYENIAAGLIAYACRMAVAKYGEQACVSLVPKTELKEHYMQQYGMMDAGSQVFLELKPLQEMISKFIL